MKTTLRVLSVLVGVALLGAIAAPAAVNLSGTWVLDRSQSEFPSRGGDKGHGPGDRAAGEAPDVKLIVQQQGDTLRVTRSIARDGKERTFTETLTTNGAEQTNSSGHGTVVSKAAWNGDRLLVTESRTMTTQNGERKMSRESVWSVSPDGRTLTIQTRMAGPRGERQMKTVYQKS